MFFKEKPSIATHDHAPPDDNISEVTSTRGLPTGTQKIEKISRTWGTKSLYTAWFGTFLLAIAISFDAETLPSFETYAASSFSSNTLLGTMNTVQNILYAVTKPPVAQFANVCGRLEAFSVSIVFLIIGYVMQASSKNISIYAASLVFYVIGQVGVQFMQQLFAADTTSMANRALFQTLVLAPTLFTTWAAAPIVNALVPNQWRWGYGIWAILVPVCAAPLLITLWLHQRSLTLQPKAQHSIWKKSRLVLRQFDVVGLILLSAGISLVLLPLGLAATASNGWKSPEIIVMIIIGALCFIAFPFYETLVPAYPILRLSLIKQRAVALGCMSIFLYYASYYIYDVYLYTYLIVARNNSATAATNITLSSTFSSSVAGILAGLWARYTGDYRWVAFAGSFVKLLGQGLMYHYRTAEASTAQVVIAQVVSGFGLGMTSIMIQAGIQSVVPHQDVASAIIIYETAASVGGSVGDAIVAAIWTNVLGKKLAQHLPASINNATSIAAIKNSVTSATSYKMGSPERIAINQSYDDVMRVCLLVAMCVLVIPIFLIFSMKQVDLRKVTNTQEEPEAEYVTEASV